MSQDSALFSVRRPRETLGGLNHNSGIPQPASALKRSNSISNLQQNAPYTVNHARSISGSRASLAPGRPNQPVFHRSNSGSNLAEMGASAVKRSSSSQMYQGSTGRKSHVPGSAIQSSAAQSTHRRSSLYSRPSSMGPIGHQSFFQAAPVPAGVPRDPRPLKDRTYQARISQELMDYLTTNGFEMEMRHTLGVNSLRSPTQKDFNFMFQWLYHRIDPSYRFMKNIDAEVPPILKQLRYPFEKSITKSQIAAVGGQNWHTFLGMLHWMMQLSQMVDRYEMGHYDDACAEAGVDVTGDRIIYRFLTAAYREWLQQDEEVTDEEAAKAIAPYIQDMANEFDASNAKYLEELAVLEAENQALIEQIKEVDKSTPDVAKLDKNYKIMDEDIGKFEQYNTFIEAKAEKYETRVKFLLEEIEKAEAELKEAESEKISLQREVDRQGISVQDIDRINTERERLQKGVETTLSRLDEAKRKVAEKESEAALRLEVLERSVEKFNSLGYQIGIIPSTAPNAGGKNYEVVITINEGPDFSASTQQRLGNSQLGGNADSDRLLADPVTGYQPGHLLNVDLRGAIRTNLMALKKDIYDRRILAQEIDVKNRDLLDGIKEAIEDKRSEVDALGHRVRAAEEEFEKTKEITTTQKLASDTQIEKMEKELAKLRAGLTESVQLMEQREMNTNIEYEQLTLKANALREELHTEIEHMLNDIIKFKVHVQKSLEDYEGFVVEEVEAELGGEDGNVIDEDVGTGL